MVSTFDCFTRFVAQAPGSMAMFDREMRYLAASPRWLADHGLAKTPLGQSHDEVFPEAGSAWKAVQRRCLAGATEGGEVERVERADGSVRWMAREAGPWTDSGGGIGGIVVSSVDVTALADARKQEQEHARRAEAAERRLRDAIDAIPSGFDLYDPDDRLIVSNAAAEAMYPHTAAARHPGITFESLLRVGVERRIHGPSEKDNERWLRERMERHREPRGPIDQLTVDGRWLRIEERRLSDGGLVIVRSDVTDIKTRERELADKTTLLEATLESMGEGIAVFDADRRLRIANAIAAELFELPPSLTRAGALLDDIFRDEARRGLFDGGDDVEAFEAGRIGEFSMREQVNATRRLRDGRTIDIRFDPMPDGGGVFVLRDVTRRAEAQEKAECLAKRLAEALERANDNARRAEAAERRLTDAIETIPNGFTIYDSNDRLVACNEAAVAMYPGMVEEVRPGVSFEHVLRAAVERGHFAAGSTDKEAWVRKRMDRHRCPEGAIEQATQAGRWLRIEERRMADGGIVIMRTDVTDLKNRERELAQKTALLEATLHNMGEGLAAFDADRKLLVINDFALGMAEFPPELTRPGVMYDDMLRALAATDNSGGGDVESFVVPRVAQFQAQQPFLIKRRLKDGRVHETRFTPTPGGGGVYIYCDVTERVAYEAKLAEKTALLEATLENMGEGIAVFGPDLKLKMWNEVAQILLQAPAALARSGTGFEDVVRLRAEQGDFGAVEVEARVRDAVALFRSQRRWVRMDTALNGRVIEARFNPMPDGGGVYVMVDVTERERAEARIREEEAKFRSLVEQEVAGIVIVRDAGTIGYCNGRFAAMLGFRPAEALGRSLLDFVPDAERPGIIQRLRDQVLRTGGPVQIAMTARGRDGNVIELLVSASRSMFEGGPAATAVVLDVTERNKAQRDLASAAAILAAVHESAPDGILVVDPAARILSVNRRFGEILGIPSELLAAGDDGAVQAAGSRNFPDSQGFVRRVQHLHDHPGETSHEELALIDGRVLDRITSPFYGADGQHLGRIWFLRDISMRRKAEDALRASEERFRMVIEEAPDAILLYDCDQERYLVANKAAERLFGVSRDEIVEHGPVPLHPLPQPDGRPAPASFADYLQRALAGGEVTFERRIRRPSSEERECRITLVRLPATVGFIRASLVDVTEQRAAEAKLAEVQRDLVARQEAERQRIARELHDSLGQYLAALNIKLQLLDQSVADASPLKPSLADLKTLTATVAVEVSRLAWELRPMALDDIGLEPAIQHLVEQWAQRSGLAFDLHLSLGRRRLSPSVETTLYRVLQEGITNVVKHAKAKRVGVILKASASDAVMIIEDDGIGFDLDGVNPTPTHGLGLLGIRERLAAVHGDLEIETSPGGGTTLILRVALHEVAAVA